MESEGLPSTSSISDNDKDNLRLLPRTFGSEVSIYIASAYAKSGRNFHDACQVLYSLQRSTSKSLEDLEGYVKPQVSNGQCGHDVTKLKHDLDTGSNSDQLEDDVKEKHDLEEKKALNSLFRHTVRVEKELRKLRSSIIVRSSPWGTLVTKPLKDTMVEYRSVIRKKEVTEKDKDKSYEDLRKELWSMKRHYGDDSDAFADEDLETAEKLNEEGHIYMVRAQDVDEEYTKKLLILERNGEEELFFDLLDFEPKEAVHFLKVQLKCFCGIETWKHLKARVKSDEENGQVGPLKRLIAKFLQREGIKWTEEGDGSILTIALDQIDRNKLSFTNK